MNVNGNLTARSGRRRTERRLKSSTRPNCLIRLSTRLTSTADAAHAISAMLVRRTAHRVTAAWGLWLAMREDSSDPGLARAYDTLIVTRPTAVNLRWALDAGRAKLAAVEPGDRVEAAAAFARSVCDEDVALNHAIGRHGLEIIREIAAKKPGETINILTHCNAGWLATVDWGTATSPMYQAHDAGLPIHVWVDETRPRNQGAYLTAWELGNHGVPHTVIVDNAGGHLMRTDKWISASSAPTGWRRTETSPTRSGPI